MNEASADPASIVAANLPYLRRYARAMGWHRSFCMRSIHHRGTVAAPGLVLALDRAAEPVSEALGKLQK